VTLEETEKNQNALYQSSFKETEGAKKNIKALHDTKKRLELENAKLKKECSGLKRKYRYISIQLEVWEAVSKRQIQITGCPEAADQGVGKRKEKLKDKMWSRSEDVRTLEKEKEDACHNSKSLENSIRLSVIERTPRPTLVSGG